MVPFLAAPNTLKRVPLLSRADIYTALLDDVKLVAGALGLVVSNDLEMLHLDSSHLRQNIARILEAGFQVAVIE